MGAKSLYLETRDKIIEQLRLANDIDMLQKIQKDYQEYLNYSSAWQKANLDEYVGQFEILSDTYNMSYNETKPRKIMFTDDGKQYEIVAAVGASYFRVVQKAFTDRSGVYHGDTYVMLNLQPPHVPGNLRGTAAKDYFNQLTHFKMTHKKGGDWLWK